MPLHDNTVILPSILLPWHSDRNLVMHEHHSRSFPPTNPPFYRKISPFRDIPPIGRVCDSESSLLHLSDEFAMCEYEWIPIAFRAIDVEDIFSMRPEPSFPLLEFIHHRVIVLFLDHACLAEECSDIRPSQLIEPLLLGPVCLVGLLDLSFGFADLGIVCGRRGGFHLLIYVVVYVLSSLFLLSVPLPLYLSLQLFPNSAPLLILAEGIIHPRCRAIDIFLLLLASSSLQPLFLLLFLIVLIFQDVVELGEIFIRRASEVRSLQDSEMISALMLHPFQEILSIPLQSLGLIVRLVTSGFGFADP